MATKEVVGRSGQRVRAIVAKAKLSRGVASGTHSEPTDVFARTLGEHGPAAPEDQNYGCVVVNGNCKPVVKPVKPKVKGSISKEEHEREILTINTRTDRTQSAKSLDTRTVVEVNRACVP